MHAPITTVSNIELMLITFAASDPDFGLGRSVLRGIYFNSLKSKCVNAGPQITNPEALVDPMYGSGRMADEPHRCPFTDPRSS